ncbi:nuclear transport factor 2 family protein [Psychrobacillus glaciei]|uniref:Nuclear transport factor 2 family protein n=1 Tax=Psychrobacillus glaciei TaxID=2283160 RepID=A0A5J6SNP5_9BACI|nr:nuclear transport factor 2 family protein [Psychrobacillus glaciei]QFF99073.1 nuclear transport factor 2 family protein [Psychrobacillus glaciei]
MGYKQCLDKYINATNTHNFEIVKQLLHPDAVFWFSNKSCTTINEIQNYFENAWEVIKEEVYSAFNVHWLAADEKTATCIYTYHYEGYYDGKFVSGSGRATNVFIKENEYEWKLIHEHLSSLS